MIHEVKNYILQRKGIGVKGYGGISGYIWEYIWKHMALIVAYGTIWRHTERRIDGNANVDI